MLSSRSNILATFASNICPAIRKKIPTFVMVLNFVIFVKFPNSSEIRNGSESPGMVVKFRSSSEIRNSSEKFGCGSQTQNISERVSTFVRPRNEVDGAWEQAMLF